jgi:ATP-dependent DNA ligase
MTALVADIHILRPWAKQAVDGRHKAGHDEGENEICSNGRSKDRPFALSARVHQSSVSVMPLALSPPLPPMEARSVDELTVGPEWQYEPKWDGFRCLIFRDGDDIALQSKAGKPVVGSLLLGLYDEEGRLDHVGFTSDIPRDDKPALTKKLEKLIAPPGFTGDAPGGPSRGSTERSTKWQPLKPELVVEIAYDHYSGGRFRHGTSLIRFRPDKAPRQCTIEQVTQKVAKPMKLLG